VSKPLILVAEDEYPLQGMVEEALTESGFETDILSSAEGSPDLVQERKQRLQGARDRRKPEGPLEWLGRGEADQGKRAGFSGRLHDRRSSGR
jgi:hypothetical protein